MKELWSRLRTAFANLSLRERILVASAGGLVLIALLVLGVVMPLLSTGSGIEQRLDATEQQLEAVTRLRREFEDVDARLSAVEERIREGARGNLRTALENLASRAGVKIESMQPQATPMNDRYRETKVELALSGVSLAQAVSYLHQIEASGQLLSIKSLRMRVRADAPELLDVRFTVSSFEPI